MYCIKCGVKLADSERVCPLCGTEVFHPDFPAGTGEPLYPVKRYPAPLENPKTAQIILTTLTTMALLITILCDVQFNGKMVWSGYVAGALIISYISLVLPFWFRKPNQVIFTPCVFTAIGLYLLYINLATGGRWFLSFAFPVVGVIGLIVTGAVLIDVVFRQGAGAKKKAKK